VDYMVVRQELNSFPQKCAELRKDTLAIGLYRSDYHAVHTRGAQWG